MRTRYPRRKTSREPYAGLGAAELNAFLQHLRTRNYSPKTVTAREKSMLDLFSSLAASGVERLQDVTTADLDRYRTEIVDRGFTINSQNNYLWAVSKFFGFLEDTKRVFVNPADGLFIPKPRRIMQPVPTEAEMKKLLAQPNVLTPVGMRDRAILEVMYSTGVRRGELLGMSLFDPDYDRGTVRVCGKGRKDRMLPLGKHAAYWLRQYTREGRPKLLKGQIDVRALWVSKDGDPVSGVRIVQMLRQYVGRAGIKKRISPHSLRRACATHMLFHGAHPVQIQMLLGHSSLQTLSQYLQVGIKEMMRTHYQTRPGR